MGTTTPPLLPGFPMRAGAAEGLARGALPGFAVCFWDTGFTFATGRAGTFAGAGRLALIADFRTLTTFFAEDLMALTLALSVLFLTGREGAVFLAAAFGRDDFGAALAAERRGAATVRRFIAAGRAFLGRAANFLVLLDFAAGMQRSSL